MLRARKVSSEMLALVYGDKDTLKNAGWGAPARNIKSHGRCESRLTYEAATGRVLKQTLSYSEHFPNWLSCVASVKTFLKKEKPILILCVS